MHACSQLLRTTYSCSFIHVHNYINLLLSFLPVNAITTYAATSTLDENSWKLTCIETNSLLNTVCMTFHHAKQRLHI